MDDHLALRAVGPFTDRNTRLLSWRNRWRSCHRGAPPFPRDVDVMTAGQRGCRSAMPSGRSQSARPGLAVAVFGPENFWPWWRVEAGEELAVFV